MIPATAEKDAAWREGGIGLGKKAKNICWGHAGFFVDLGDLWWDLERVKCLMLCGEESLGTEGRACSVLFPFVLEQPQVRGDVEVLLGVCRARFVAAVNRIGAIVILRPEAVEDEAGVGRALRRGPLDGAELRCPGKIHEVEVEFTGRRGLLCAAGWEDAKGADCKKGERNRTQIHATTVARGVACLLMDCS